MSTQENAKGSLLGAILLIAGCCIGAGMLGLPVLSGLAGFVPSLVMFFISWAFMTCTGLLLLEANLWFSKDVSIITIAGHSLGTIGKCIGWTGFLFLFYALMVAYISGSGEMVADFVQGITSYAMAPLTGSILVSILFGICIYLGTGAVDRVNRVLMIGLVVTYIALVFGGIPHIDLSLLEHREWSSSTLVLPAMIISFGFHNLVPTLTTYMHGDRRRLRLAVIVGSSIPLVIYILWEGLILGLIPVEGEGGFRQALSQGDMATQALRAALGSTSVVEIAQTFAFFALITSFLGVALSFVDFLADGLKVKKDAKGKVGLCVLVLLPSFICAAIYPHIFLSALNYAGGFGAVLLFGILPAVMVWNGRYCKHFKTEPMVPGGKLLLVIVILFACFVMGLQAKHLITNLTTA